MLSLPLSVVSSVFAGGNPEYPEEKFQLYVQIIDFFKGLCCINPQLKQVGRSGVRGDLVSPPLVWQEGPLRPPHQRDLTSHHRGPLGADVPSFSRPVPWMVGISLTHPGGWETSRETEGRRTRMVSRAGLRQGVP